MLGEHVKQQGSLVAPDRLRFDFSHYEPVTPEQIRQIEDLANREILDNDPVHHYETTKANAEQLGAIAFFGDKYGDVVRVLEAGRHSIELCGGTHVRALGDIGPIKIVREESIGSNLRRIEAVTGTGPIERLRDEEQLIDSVAQLLNVPREDLLDGARKRLDEIKTLRDEVKTLRREAATGRSAELRRAGGRRRRGGEGRRRRPRRTARSRRRRPRRGGHPRRRARVGARRRGSGTRRARSPTTAGSMRRR